jgi:hypothetical protein
MKIVVIGGTGLIGAKVVAKLRAGGHVSNSHGSYYGGAIANSALVPAGKAGLGAIDFEKWLAYLLSKQASTLS